MKNRKLNFKEGILLCKIFKDIKMKENIDTLKGVLDGVDANSDSGKMELGLEIILFIIENLDTAENNIKKFVASYTGKDVEAVDGMTLDEIEDFFMAVYEAGLPNVLSKYLNLKKTN